MLDVEGLRGIAAYGVGPALGLISGPILAHAMGPAERGRLAAILQPTTVAAAFASVGIPSAVTFFVARGADPRRTLLRGLRLCALPASVVCAVMAVYAVSVAARQHVPLGVILLCWCAIAVTAAFQVRRAVWQGCARWALIDTERAAQAILRFAAVVTIAAWGVSSASVYAVASTAALIVGSFVLLRALPARRGASDGSGAIGGDDRVGTPRSVPVPSGPALARYASLSAVGTIALVAGARMDQMLMPVASTSVELGYYAVAVTIAEVPIVLSTLAARNALQRAATGRPTRAIVADVRIYLAACVCAVVAIVALAPVVTPAVFGRAFEPSVVPMQILAVATVFTWVGEVCAAVATGRGRPGLGSVVFVGSVGTTVVAFAVLWGGVTSTLAAIVSLSGSVVAALTGVVVVARLRYPRASAGAGDEQVVVAGAPSRDRERRGAG